MRKDILDHHRVCLSLTLCPSSCLRLRRLLLLTVIMLMHCTTVRQPDSRCANERRVLLAPLLFVPFAITAPDERGPTKVADVRTLVVVRFDMI
jgi:hypothetical protein